MGIKRIKIQNQRTAADSGYFKKPHRTTGFHENPEKRSQIGFWAVILLWVSGPRQTNRQDLGFRTSTDRLTELTKILKKSPVASPASPFPHLPKPPSQT